jgi:hypothetical protein
MFGEIGHRLRGLLSGPGAGEAEAARAVHTGVLPDFADTFEVADMYMVSRNTASPTVSEPRWRCSTAWAARRSRSARSVTGPPSLAARASAAASRVERRFNPATRSTSAPVHRHKPTHESTHQVSTAPSPRTL